MISLLFNSQTLQFIRRSFTRQTQHQAFPIKFKVATRVHWEAVALYGHFHIVSIKVKVKFDAPSFTASTFGRVHLRINSNCLVVIASIESVGQCEGWWLMILMPRLKPMLMWRVVPDFVKGVKWFLNFFLSWDQACVDSSWGEKKNNDLLGWVLHHGLTFSVVIVLQLICCAGTLTSSNWVHPAGVGWKC